MNTSIDNSLHKFVIYYNQSTLVEKLEQFTLWNFLFFSILTPTTLDGYRLLMLFFFFALKLRNRKLLIPQRAYLYFISIIILYNLIQFYIGYFRFGSVSIVEAKGIVLYFSIYAGLIFVVSEKDFKTIYSAIIFGSICVGSYFFYIFLGRQGYLPYRGDFLNQEYDLIFSEGRIKMYAIHISNLTYTLPFLMLYYIGSSKKSVLNLIAIIIPLFAVLISLRRGVILSSFIGIVFVVLLKGKTNYLKLVLVSSVLLALLLFSLNFYFNKTGVESEAFWKEITSSVDFRKNHSNLIRVEQTKFFIEKIKENPVFGIGIGANDPLYRRSQENSAQFEMQYLKIIYATGFLGLFLLVSFASWGVWTAIKKIRNSTSSVYLAPVLGGFIATLVYNASNPFFSQFSHIFMFFHLFYVLKVTKSSA